MSNTAHYLLLDTPIGDLTIVGHESALTGLYMHAHRHQPDPATFGVRQSAAQGVLREAVHQVNEYFYDGRRAFELPLDPVGTPFQQSVWLQLRAIPFGQTRSYGELARELGAPGSSRAVGMANGRNPLSIVVPCHRVIGVNGAMTGFGGGIERKVWLLHHEKEGVLSLEYVARS